ncbi:uncharacterized protein [Dermacentor albipictus]|uniref:uncharacterized protein n=1 Tax=Dermacentor albipictus TaxID=60249 RepID=UPI0031FD60FC
MSRASFNELLIEEVAKRPLLWDFSLGTARSHSNMHEEVEVHELFEVGTPASDFQPEEPEGDRGPDGDDQPENKQWKKTSDDGHSTQPLFEDIYNFPECPPETPGPSGTPAPRPQRQGIKRKRGTTELEVGDAQLAAVKTALAAFKPLTSTGYFLLSLEEAMNETPKHMQSYLRQELLNVVSSYSRGVYADLIVMMMMMICGV